jgi:HlyD family secretion protein
VDEADIGLIRRARAESQPVEFTVDAYPEELFCGEIAQIRLSPTVNQNVVTYPVVVSAPNPEEKLMPGMTAELSFRIDRRPECVRVPNAALRFFPDVRHVRESDRGLITGTQEWDDRVVDDESAAEKTAAASDRDRRHVWVWDNATLRAVPVTVGIRDSQWSELISGKLSPGDRLVVGEKT